MGELCSDELNDRAQAKLLANLNLVLLIVDLELS